MWSSSLSFPPPDSPAGLSPSRRRRPWWLAPSGRGVWLFLVVGFLLGRSFQANKRRPDPVLPLSSFVLLFLKLMAARMMGEVGFVAVPMLAPIGQFHGDVLLWQWLLPHLCPLLFPVEAYSWCLRSALEGGEVLLLVGAHGGRRQDWNLAGASQISSLVSSGHLARWIRRAAVLSLAGHGGEGSKRSSASSSSSRGWWGWFVLQFGVNYTVAVLAAVIYGRSSGPSSRRAGDSSTSRSEAFTGAARRSPASSRRQVVRPRRSHGGRQWRLNPGGEGHGLDHFLLLCSRVLGVKVQGSILFSFYCQGPACNLYPPTFY